MDVTHLLVLFSLHGAMASFFVMPGRSYQRRQNAAGVKENPNIAGYHPAHSECEEWKSHKRSSCSVTCGTGQRLTDVYCRDRHGRWYYSSKTRRCSMPRCPEREECPVSARVYASQWTICSKSCTGGTQQRQRFCWDWRMSQYRAITPETRSCGDACTLNSVDRRQESTRGSYLPQPIPNPEVVTKATTPVTTPTSSTTRTTSSTTSASRSSTRRPPAGSPWETATLLAAGCMKRHGVHIEGWSTCSVTCGSGVQQRRRFCWSHGQHWVMLARENRSCGRSCDHDVTSHQLARGIRRERAHGGGTGKTGRQQTRRIVVDMITSVFVSKDRLKGREEHDTRA